MIYALTEQAARRSEERVVAETGVTLGDLMSRAGAAVAAEVARRVPYGAVAVVAGKGNNGGDGWVAARALHSRGREVTVYTPVEPGDLEGDAGEAAERAIAAGIRFSVLGDQELAEDALSGYAAVVDAMFGIGLHGPMRAPYPSWSNAMNRSGATVVSVDIPSGLDADTGMAEEGTVEADVTVTFSAPKVGVVQFPGARYAGEVVVADIGIPRSLLGEEGDPEIWEPADYRGLLPRSASDAHKNQRGRVLVIGGSGAFPGAVALAAHGAARMGAGYVTVAVPESIAPILQTKFSSMVVVGLAENPSKTFASKVAEELLDMAREYDAVVLGPGITLAHGAVLVVRRLVSGLAVPLVVDADGLNALVDAMDVLDGRSSPTVLTPHPGELARLLDTTVAAVQSDRLCHGARLAGPDRVCVLKGARTVISGNGRQVVNSSGGPALATAGTGDVLSGIIGTLLAKGLDPLEASALGTRLHGRAGDLAAADLTESCVISQDVPEYLPRAVKELLGG